MEDIFETDDEKNEDIIAEAENIDLQSSESDVSEISDTMEDVRTEKDFLERKNLDQEDLDLLGLQIIEVLFEQQDLILVLRKVQKAVRQAVNEKNWELMESSLDSISAISDSFSNLEEMRLELLMEIPSFVYEAGEDIYQVAGFFMPKIKNVMIETYRSIRQEVTASKVENDSLTEYIRVSKDFLQGVFDTVVPQRRNVVYTRKGLKAKIMKSQPTSLILNELT